MYNTILIKNKNLYYGKVDILNEISELDHHINTMNFIPSTSVQFIHLNKKKHQLTIFHHKQEETLIELDKKQSLSTIEYEILHTFPESDILGNDQTNLQLIKKPLIGIAVILIFVILASLVKPDYQINQVTPQRHNFFLFVQLIKSLGIHRILAISGILILFPLASIYFKLKKSKDITIIKF